MKITTFLRKKLNILIGLILSSLLLLVWQNLDILPEDVLVDPTPTPVTATPSATVTQGRHGDPVTVVSVVDGDTIKVTGGEIVRYIGMNTPETVSPGRPVECFGKEASAKNKELVQGKTVELESDISSRDTFGRLLRYVWVGDTLVNEVLVREGYAQVSTYPPDVKYQERFLLAQRLAIEEKKGVWGGACPVPPPARFQPASPSGDAATPSAVPSL